ncbi:hypothetical protein Neosp_009045 [[Neocosmospora] mangrovei]
MEQYERGGIGKTDQKPSNSPSLTRDIQEGSMTDLKGTSLDDAILRAQGHETVMRRNFNLLSSLGLGFGITNSWVGALSNFGQNLKYGGPQLALFSVLIACFVQWIITLGLSEQASAFPSSGGQYHFVYLVAPPKTRRFGAFVTGWMSILGWWIGTCSGLSLVANSILGLVSFVNPSYTSEQWHVYLVYLAVLLITVVPLFAFPRSLPIITTSALYLTITGFVAWLITILVMKDHVNPGDYLTRSTPGTSGWSPGPAWILGIINSMYCFTGTDGAIHIAEEMKGPGKRLPQIMCVNPNVAFALHTADELLRSLTMAIGLATAFPIILVFMLVMKDMDLTMNSGMPAVELLYQATGSRSATVGLTIYLIIIYASNLPPQWIACGRLAWAFARDKGTPYPNYFAQVHPTLGFPVRTTVAALCFGTIYGLLYLASTTAFNSIITTAVLLLNVSYAIPQATAAIQGRSKVLPKRPLNLGRYGYFCNIFAPLWITAMGIFVCFPPAIPVTVGSMNYTAPILVGLFLCIVGCWCWIGDQFEGPVIDWEMLNMNNELETTHGS